VCLRALRQGPEQGPGDGRCREGEERTDEERRVIPGVQRDELFLSGRKEVAVLDVAMLTRIASPSAPPIMKGVFTTPDDRKR
jgi:hypothetical protein